MTAIDVKMVWSLRQADTSVLCEGEWTGKVEPLCATWLPKMDFSEEYLADKDKRRERYFAYALYQDGVCVSSGTTLFTPAKHFRFVNPVLQASVQDTEDAFLVTIAAQAYARYVEIDLREADAIFSDNVFDIADQEPVTLRVKKESLSTPLTKEAFEEQLMLRSVYDLSH
jgi:beta-mannosidase